MFSAVSLKADYKKSIVLMSPLFLERESRWDLLFMQLFPDEVEASAISVHDSSELLYVSTYQCYYLLSKI